VRSSILEGLLGLQWVKLSLCQSLHGSRKDSSKRVASSQKQRKR